MTISSSDATWGAANLGLYSRGYQLIQMPAALFGQVATDVLFPLMARVQHDRPRLAAIYRSGLGSMALVVLPLTGFLSAISHELVAVLLGEQWVPLTAAFDIMVFGTLFRTGYKLSDAVSRATGAVYRRATRSLVYAGLVVGGALVGQHWGIAGVAAAVLLALTVNYLSMAQLGMSLTGLTVRSFLSAHLPGLLLGGVVYAACTVAGAAARGAGLADLVVVLAVALVAVGSVVAVLRVAASVRPDGAFVSAVKDSLTMVPGPVRRAGLRVIGTIYSIRPSADAPLETPAPNPGQDEFADDTGPSV